MDLCYDIDFQDLGTGASAHFAAFRDPRTAEAARRASPRIKAILSEAGLCLDTRLESDAPHGHYALRDKAKHEYFLSCFVDAITVEPENASAIAQGDFDPSQFLIHLSAARPYGAIVAQQDGLRATPAGTRPDVSRAVYFAVSLLAASGYMAGFAVLG